MQSNKVKKGRVRTYKSSEPTLVIPDGWCHQCKMKQPSVIACQNFWKKKNDNRCNGKYCARCIQRHYQQNMEDLTKANTWMCYSCCGTCTCAVCQRKRGNYVAKRKSPSNKIPEISKKAKKEVQKIPIAPPANLPCYIPSAENPKLPSIDTAASDLLILSLVAERTSLPNCNELKMSLEKRCPPTYLPPRSHSLPFVAPSVSHFAPNTSFFASRTPPLPSITTPAENTPSANKYKISFLLDEDNEPSDEITSKHSPRSSFDAEHSVTAPKSNDNQHISM